MKIWINFAKTLTFASVIRMEQIIVSKRWSYADLLCKFILIHLPQNNPNWAHYWDFRLINLTVKLHLSWLMMSSFSPSCQMAVGWMSHKARKKSRDEAELRALRPWKSSSLITSKKDHWLNASQMTMPVTKYSDQLRKSKFLPFNKFMLKTSTMRNLNCP